MQIMRALFMKKYKEKALCDDIVMPSFNYCYYWEIRLSREKTVGLLKAGRALKNVLGLHASELKHVKPTFHTHAQT